MPTDGGTVRPVGQLAYADVAVLFPLPKDRAATGLLRASDSGPRGTLLSLRAAAELPPLGLAAGNNAEIHEQLRVTSIRIDPCAETEPGKGGCSPQLRLVFGQWLGASEGFEDMGVHATYGLTAEAFDTIMATVMAIRAENGGAPLAAPLGVHPVMASQGLQGKVASAYRKLVLDHVGESNLVRVTFMSFGTLGGRSWEFGGFDVAQGVFTRMTIPGGGESRAAKTQEVGLGSGGEIIVRSGTGELLDDDPMKPLMSAERTARATTADVAAAVDRAVKVESPTFGSVNTLPCVGCHIATQAQAIALQERHVDASKNPARFVTSRNISLDHSTGTNTTADRFMPMRAFGYNGTEPVFTRRVVLESAVTLDRLAGP